MTTIAYRSGIMAADSAIVAGDALAYRARKLLRLPNGAVAGFAGPWSLCMRLLAWLESGAEEESRPGALGTVGLVVRPSGHITRFEDGVAVRVVRTPCIAIGTGAHIALGAMHAGASAVGAVRAAIAYDNSTRGPVVFERLRRRK